MGPGLCTDLCKPVAGPFIIFYAWAEFRCSRSLFQPARVAHGDKPPAAPNCANFSALTDRSDDCHGN